MMVSLVWEIFYSLSCKVAGILGNILLCYMTSLLMKSWDFQCLSSDSMLIRNPGNSSSRSNVLLIPQESQAIPLLSVASVAGRAKRQMSYGPEEQLEKSPKPPDLSSSGTAAV